MLLNLLERKDLMGLMVCFLVFLEMVLILEVLLDMVVGYDLWYCYSV